MPRGDRTGPRGLGNMTGKGAGFCAGNQAAGTANSNSGKAAGGRGRGLGLCNGVNNMGLPGGRQSGSENDSKAQASPGTANNRNSEQAEALQKQLNELSSRLDAIDKQK